MWKTYERNFGKKQCNNVKLQESKHECTDRTVVFSDYTKRRILLLRERGKTHERNFGTAAEERYSSESSRDFEVFIEVQAEVQ